MLANLLYSIALVLLSPMILYRMLRHGRYRRGLREKLIGLSPAQAARLRGAQDCVWIHAVSVGEANLLPGIVQRLQDL
jgi:3-deoxy-D-manno-octulosonic-acid transferase